MKSWLLAALVVLLTGWFCESRADDLSAGSTNVVAAIAATLPRLQGADLLAAGFEVRDAGNTYQIRLLVNGATKWKADLPKKGEEAKSKTGFSFFEVVSVRTDNYGALFLKADYLFAGFPATYVIFPSPQENRYKFLSLTHAEIKDLNSDGQVEFITREPLPDAPCSRADLPSWYVVNRLDMTRGRLVDVSNDFPDFYREKAGQYHSTIKEVTPYSPECADAYRQLLGKAEKIAKIGTNASRASGTARAEYAPMLQVPFFAQGPGNNNCGPACLAMAVRSVTGGPAGQKDIDDINRFLHVDSEAYKSIQQLASAANDLYRLTGVKSGHWSLDEIKQNIMKNNGPVIVGVNSTHLPNRNYSYAGGHFVLVFGVNVDFSSGNYQLICHDPGSRNNSYIIYDKESFQAAIGAAAAPVVYGFKRNGATGNVEEFVVKAGETAGGFLFFGGNLWYDGKPIKQDLSQYYDLKDVTSFNVTKIKNRDVAIAVANDDKTPYFYLDLKHNRLKFIDYAARKVFSSPVGKYLLIYHNYEGTSLSTIDLFNGKMMGGDLVSPGKGHEYDYLYWINSYPDWDGDNKVSFLVVEKCNYYNNSECPDEVRSIYKVTYEIPSLHIISKSSVGKFNNIRYFPLF